MSLNTSSFRSDDINLFCFGLGYVAQRFKPFFPLMTGTSRTTTQGTVLFSDCLAVQNALQKATHVLISIPPFGGQDLVLETYLASLKQSPTLKWVGYLSATSVYGDHQGEWVHEESLCHPRTKRGKDRLSIEAQWLASGLPAHVFRLAGIYGPGRSVFERLQLKNIQRIHKAGHFFSRIHVEDIVQILKASMLQPTPTEVFNVADDLPTEQNQIIEYACDLLKHKLPPLIPFEKACLSEMMKEFYQDNKKVLNQKVKKRFNIDLCYPTYKEGLRSLVDL